jgi:TonB family protein
MKQIGLACLVSWLAVSAVGQSQEPLYVTHLEAPDYPPMARTANLQGKVTVTATIDGDGKVIDATADEYTSAASKLLQKYALENIRRWTFGKPQTALYSQVVVYEYRLDSSRPTSDCPSTEVSFDLPGHVTIIDGLVQPDGYVTKPAKPK